MSLDSTAASPTLVPVFLNGVTEFLPLNERETPTYLVMIEPGKEHLLTTSDPNGDRISVGAINLAEAIGQVLMDNPKLSYEDIADHMEI